MLSCAAPLHQAPLQVPHALMKPLLEELLLHVCNVRTGYCLLLASNVSASIACARHAQQLESINVDML